MATNIITSPGAFDVQGPEPLDLRIVQPLLQNMYDIPVAKRHLGLKVYVEETKKEYILREGLGSFGVADDWEDLLPYASETVAGLIKVGTNLSIDEFGVLHATGGGGGDLADGNYVDVTVSNGGLIWTVNNGVINTDKLGGDITVAGKALLDDDTAEIQRATLGLGDLATATGTWEDGSTVSGSNTGDQDAENIDTLLAGITPTHLHTQYATLDSPTFTGVVSLPATTSIGNLSAQEIDYLADITSSVQTQLNNRMQIDVQYNGDLDSILTTGDYRIVTGATNYPFAASVNGSKLIHTNWNVNFARQVFYDYASDRIFTRRKVNTWQSWNEIVLTSMSTSSIRTTYSNMANDSYFDVPAGHIIESIVMETGATTSGNFTLGLTQALPEISQLVITHDATSAGNVTVILNGVSTNIAVSMGMPAAGVAAAIRNTSFSGWTTGGSSTSVTFTSTTTGNKTDISFAGGGTGVTANPNTMQQGSVASSDIVSSIAVGPIQGYLQYLTISRPSGSLSTTLTRRMYVGITTIATVKLYVTTRLF